MYAYAQAQESPWTRFLDLTGIHPIKAGRRALENALKRFKKQVAAPHDDGEPNIRRGGARGVRKLQCARQLPGCFLDD